MFYFSHSVYVFKLFIARQIYLNLFSPFSLNSDVASGRETSDFESLASGSKGDVKPRKHHRKSSRTRSRQEKTSKPKLSMLNVSHGVNYNKTKSQTRQTPKYQLMVTPLHTGL